MRDCNERERSTDIVSRTMRKTATRSWGIGFTARIASLIPKYSGLRQLGGLGMRAVAGRCGRGRVSHGLGLRRPAFWLAAGLIFAANCIATKYDKICRNEDFSMPPNGDKDDFSRIQTRNFSSEQGVSNDDPENRVPTRNTRLPRRRGLGKEFLIRANRAQSEN